MKKLTSLLFILQLFFYGYINGQNDPELCIISETNQTTSLYNGSCVTNPNGEWAIYRNMNTYIPSLNTSFPMQNPPITTIEININIIQKDDSSGNFVNNQDTRDRLNAIVGFVNSFYSNYAPSDPISWVQELPGYDSRIRFSLGEVGHERIYFYQNTSAWDDTFVTENIQDFLENNYPERLEKLNLYIFGNPTSANWAHASMPSWINFDAHSWVVMKYWGSDENDWAKATLLAHEFGHNFELFHTYVGGGATAICDQTNENFLQDVFLVELPSVSNCPHTGGWSNNPYILNGDRITNNLLGGTSAQSYISPQQAGQMHRALAVTSVRKYVKCEKSQVPMEITGNHIWDFDIKLYRDLIIQENGHLTISCHLAMHPNAKIIIKPGGVLTIDGGTIGIDVFETDPWQGIEVWGNSTASQYALPGQPCPQGKLILQNGATIENAYNAVTLWKPGDYSKSGGIVQAKDAIFRNNKRSVEFISYQNFNPLDSTELFSNASRFTHCSFVIDENYMVPSPFNAHITMWQVDGIQLKGNTFTGGLSGNLGKGIYSIDANYQLLPYCNSQMLPCPSQSIILNSFTGFDAAVEAGNTISERAILVDQTRFINNGYGVKLSGSNNASITRSIFEIGSLINELCDDNFGIGIELSNCNGYVVEENNFSLASGNTGEGSIGVRVFYDPYTEAYTNNIYRNTYTGVNRANLAEGKNRVDVYTQYGLVYKCNINASNIFDFYFTGLGVASQQGSLSLSAGNTFSTMSGNVTLPRHIANYASNHIDYYYSAATNHEPIYTTNVTKHLVTTTHSCPSSFGGGIGEIELSGLSNQQESYFEEELATNRTAYNSLSNLYTSLVDGGNTSTMISAVETAWPEDMWELRAQLLGGSPHLSKEVLKKAADRTDVLPESIIFEVLSTNPDELKDNELMEYLQTKAEPLPEYMMDVLESLKGNITYKTILQSQMAHYSLEQAKAERALLHNIVHDSISNMQALRTQLAAAQSLPMDMQIVDAFMQEGKTSEALSLANMLPQLYGLTAEGLTEHNRFVGLKQLQTGLYNEGRNIFTMNETEKSTLIDMISQSEGLAGIQARNIMAFIGEYEYCDCPSVIDASLKNKAVINATTVQSLLGPTVEARPNPASTWVGFVYTLEGEKFVALLEIRDATGKTIHQAQLNQKQGEYIWDTRQVKAGAYYYSLKTDTNIKSGKVIITK